MTQQNSDTVYGVPKAEWLTMTSAQMRQAKRQHDEAIRDRNREATRQYLAELDAKKQAQSAEAARERDEKAHERTVRELRRGFFAADPTATQADFDASLPKLLETHRNETALAARSNVKRFAASRVRRSL